MSISSYFTMFFVCIQFVKILLVLLIYNYFSFFIIFCFKFISFYFMEEFELPLSCYFLCVCEFIKNIFFILFQRVFHGWKISIVCTFLLFFYWFFGEFVENLYGEIIIKKNRISMPYLSVFFAFFNSVLTKLFCTK